MADIIVVADTIITMDEEVPRAEAVAVSKGRIAAIGSVDHCQAILPGAKVVQTGAGALLPGFVEPHGHPILAGLLTMPPFRLIAPWKAPTWPDVVAEFKAAIAETNPSQPLLFNGFDSLLHGRSAPDAAELDKIFGDRIVVVFDNSGHGVYFSSAMIKWRGWDKSPPNDPVGGHFGRKQDGSLDGRGYEVPVLMNVVKPLAPHLGNPSHSAALFYVSMSRAGYTSTSEMAYDRKYGPAYSSLSLATSCPLRVSLFEVSTANTCADRQTFPAGDEMLRKAGVKMWTDGAVWVGTGATSFPYLDSDATRRAGIDPAKAGGVQSLNYTREELDRILDKAAPAGWQMALHSNGDLAVEMALDAYEAALKRHGLTGTDHRWRVEHASAASREQLARAAKLGVHVSMSPFQHYFWGHLLDGEIFDHEHGSRWQPFADARASGVCFSFHNDGPVSPPEPLVNIQTAVSRRTRVGSVHGPEQSISLHDALKAQTIDAAKALRREHLVGSISVGKAADFVELSSDPYKAGLPEESITKTVQVRGTWVGGQRVDHDAFLNAVLKTRFTSSRSSGANTYPVLPCC